MVTRTLRLVALMLVAALLCEAGLPKGLAQPKKINKSDAYVKITATADKPAADGTQLITLSLAIDKGWHLYANPVGNKDLDEAATIVLFPGKIKPAVVKIDYPAGKVIKDATLGDYKVYEDTVAIKAQIKRAPGAGPVELGVRVQACNDKFCAQTATVPVTVP